MDPNKIAAVQKSPPAHLFTVAIKQLNKSKELIATHQDAKLYDGYLSALGPTVRQIGLVPALANYTTESKSARSKAPLLRYLQNIMADPDARLFAPSEEKTNQSLSTNPAGITLYSLKDTETPTLFGKVGKLDDTKRAIFQYHFQHVIIAAKLALRAYLPLSRTIPQPVDHEEE